MIIDLKGTLLGMDRMMGSLPGTAMRRRAVMIGVPFQGWMRQHLDALPGTLPLTLRRLTRRMLPEGDALVYRYASNLSWGESG
jgi:hypothetical protein